MPDALSTPRHRDILLAVIETYIETAEPVGSRALVRRYAFSFSPATIRNVMADLEEEGYLVAPHTSAGRIPTERAYRYYADVLLSSRRARPREMRGVREALSAPEGGGGEDLFRRASRVLSRFSHLAGVVLGPRPLHDAFRRVELVRIRPGTVLVILVSTRGTLQHRLAQTAADHPQEELEKMARLLNQRFAGLPLDEMRRRILEEMREDKTAYDRMLQAALALSAEALKDAGGNVYLEGSVNIMEVPEFAADIEAMRSLFRAFEEKGRLVDLLDRTMKAEGLAVVIGSEAHLPGMSDISLVASPYGAEDAPLGTLGIIGPTRMDYSHVIPLVEATARALTERLAGEEG